MAATIAEPEPQAQADWLWDNYAEHTGAAPLERGDFGGALPAHALVPATCFGSSKALHEVCRALLYLCHSRAGQRSAVPAEHRTGVLPTAVADMFIAPLVESSPCVLKQTRNCCGGDPRWKAPDEHAVRAPV